MTTLVLITDSLPSKYGGGISQTLYNIFEYLKPEQIRYLHDTRERISEGNIFSQHNISTTLTSIRPFRNRLAKYFNPLIQFLNFTLREYFTPVPTGLPHPKECFILVSTTDPAKLHYAYLLEKKRGYKVVPYFMDDWIADCKQAWLGNNIQQVAGYLINQATHLILISEYLNAAFSERYNIAQARILIVHNPVDVDLIREKNNSGAAGKKIIYAGSIWPMHYDAILLTARATRLCREMYKHDLILEICCAPEFWAIYKNELESEGVVYGGYKRYDELHAYLNTGWLLLVASSFGKEYEKFTQSSVQTKVTDYLVTDVPIISVGPEEGACNRFLLHWQCGFVFTSNNPNELARFLMDEIKNDSYSENVKRGHELVRNQLSKRVIQSKVRDFLQSV